jgi:hypothetical protein
MLGDLLAWGAERVFGQRPGELLRLAAEDGGLTEPSEPGRRFQTGSLAETIPVNGKSPRPHRWGFSLPSARSRATGSAVIFESCDKHSPRTGGAFL